MGEADSASNVTRKYEEAHGTVRDAVFLAGPKRWLAPQAVCCPFLHRFAQEGVCFVQQHRDVVLRE